MKIGKRTEVLEDADGIIAHIRTDKNIAALIFIPVILVFWGLFAVAAVGALLEGANQKSFVIPWLVFWLIWGGLAAFGWFWNAFGQEVVSIKRESFEYRRELFGLAVTKKTIPVSELTNMRAVGPATSEWTPHSGAEAVGFTDGVISIDRGRATTRFGVGLKAWEAVALIAELQPFLPKAFAERSMSQANDFKASTSQANTGR